MMHTAASNGTESGVTATIIVYTWRNSTTFFLFPNCPLFNTLFFLFRGLKKKSRAEEKVMRRDTCVLWQRRTGCDNMAFIVEGYPKALKKQVRRPSGSTLIDLVQPQTHADHAVDTLYL